MIKVLHGENLVESRKSLINLREQAKKEGIDIVVLDTQTTLSELRSALESGSLLGKNRLVIVENLLSSPKAREKNKILEYLEKEKFDNDLILWEAKEIKKIPLVKAKTEIFKVNQIIFRFLESLRPGNNKEMLDLLGQVKTKEEPEMIFYMLIRQLRLLILAQDQCLSGLVEWQQRKLQAQARHFAKDKLKELYAELLEIDFAQKTSNDPFSLSSRLDLLIATL